MVFNTNITLFRNANGNLNKHINFNGSKVSKALLYEGKYVVKKIDNLSELDAVLGSLELTDAIGLGIPSDGSDTGNIVTASNVATGSIARSKKYFNWNSDTQILLFDYDYFDEMNENMRADTPEQYRELLIQLDERFSEVQMLIVPSSSCGIFNNDTNEVVLDSKGMHAYIIVNGVENIDIWIDNLFAKAWELGLACIKFSKDGKRLSRTVFDVTVFSPERLIFEAPATLDVGLIQRATKRYYVDGGLIDLDNEVSLASCDKEIEAFKKAETKSLRIQTTYTEDKVAEMVADGVDKDKAVKFVKSRCENGLIERDDVITLADGRKIVAKEFTDQHDGKYCLDPIEPNEANAIVNVDSNANVMIYSFLHGGRKFFVRDEEFEHKSLPVVLEPINPNTYYEKFSLKWLEYGNVVTPQLQETWKLNCIAMNNACTNKSNIKYVVPAATGSGKTEGIITYCALLPRTIKVLISTNLTAEADRIALAINKESSSNIAVAFYSKNKITTSIAATYQIVVVSHEFYRRNYKGNNKWNVLGNNRDLILIDEALDTMKEISVSAKQMQTTISIVKEISSWKRYKGNKSLKSELYLLEAEYNILTQTHKDLGRGTQLINSEKADKIVLGSIDGLDVPEHLAEKFASDVLMHKYSTIEKILLDDKKIRYSKILTTVDNVTSDSQIKKKILGTLENLEQFTGGQLYLTSNQGQYSYHKVLDAIPKHSVVCFDATADVNKIYDLRSKHHNDLLKVKRVDGVRDYSTVDLYTAVMSTGKSSIDIGYVENVMSNVTLGEKTLIITHKGNESLFITQVKSQFSDKEIDVAHWGALTGLNKWQDCDTCIVAGLNHKPTFYAQNRAIVSTDEETAFGKEQQHLHHSITITDLVAEIVQAINRIRVRKIVDVDGRCKSAKIYITLPVIDNKRYKTFIASQMPNINILEWKLANSANNTKRHGFLPAIISYLESHLVDADEISIFEPRDILGMQKDSYRRVVNKVNFEQKLHDYGFEIVLKYELDKLGRKKKRPNKYIRRIK